MSTSASWISSPPGLSCRHASAINLVITSRPFSSGVKAALQSASVIGFPSMGMSANGYELNVFLVAIADPFSVEVLELLMRLPEINQAHGKIQAVCHQEQQGAQLFVADAPSRVRQTQDPEQSHASE